MDDWYDLFKKMEHINEEFTKGKEMIHEDMPEDVRQFVRGALYHLDPAKVFKVSHGSSGDPKGADYDPDKWTVTMYTYQRIALADAKEFFDNIMEEELGMHGFDPDAQTNEIDPEWPAYHQIIGDQDIELEIFIKYETPDDESDDDDDDTTPGMEDMLGKFGAGRKGRDSTGGDEDPEDWWKKGSDKYDPENWKK